MFISKPDYNFIFIKKIKFKNCGIQANVFVYLRLYKIYFNDEESH